MLLYGQHAGWELPDPHALLKIIERAGIATEAEIAAWCEEAAPD